MVLFYLAEYITIVYGNEPIHMAIFWSKISGKFAPLFWLHFTLCFVIPLPILAVNKFRTIRELLLPRFRSFWNVVGTVCHHRSHLNQTENAHPGGFLHSNLGRVVHLRWLHLSLHAPLYLLYKGFPYCSCVGGQRRQGEGCCHCGG